MSKIFVIGLDGATFDLIRPWAEQGKLPALQRLMEACEKLGYTYHVGAIWTTDALLRETKEMIQDMCDLNVMGVDMISSSLLTVAQVKGVRAGGILAVSDNLITGELGFVSPKYFEAETQTIDVAFEAIKILESKK